MTVQIPKSFLFFTNIKNATKLLLQETKQIETLYS